MISNRVNTFLSNFHYLNDKDKRSGCGIFCNKALSVELAKNAKQLRDDLTALAQNNVLSDDDKNAEFFKIMTTSFQSAIELRAKYGKLAQPKKDPMFKMMDEQGKQTETVKAWKKPYKPGKFELQLVNGLNAVDHELAQQLQKPDANIALLKPLQEKCQHLIREISTYQCPDRYFGEVVTKRLKG